MQVETTPPPPTKTPRPLRRLLLASHSRGSMIAALLSGATSDLRRAQAKAEVSE